MSNNEIVGHCSCPVCGAEGQDIKVNKNNKLYMFCDNGCAIKWNSGQSRKYLPMLYGGGTIPTETGLILKSTMNKENKNEKSGYKTAGIDGNSAGRRADGRIGTVISTRSSTGGTKPGWLATILSDDE